LDLDADLLMSRTLTEDARQDIEQAFRAAGLRPTAYRVPPRRGPEELSWLVIAALPLSSFLTTLGSKLAEDSYKELRQLAHRVLKRAPAPKRSTLVLEDRDSGTQVVLDLDLPDVGYRTLLTADFAGHRGKIMRFDRIGRGWVARDT
jgi:hypothetical protein